MPGSSFATMESVVSSILLEIGDEANRRYYVRAMQWAMDAYREITVHESPYYLERKVAIDPDLYFGVIPNDSISLISVGVYRNGEYHSFTKKPNMSIPTVDMEDGLFNMDEADTLAIPEKGGRMGYNGSNIGYWREDRENCRFFVRNYAYLQSSGLVQDTTSDLVTKVVIRYKSNGLDCSKDLCVPVEAKDLLVALVYYKFICKNMSR